jgi:formylglycine-generating enzyme required for sulfatase activity
MANANRLLRVFLCYASADEPDAHALYQRLLANGVDAWIDKEKLLPGQNWQEEISKAIRNSDVVIVCLSENSVNKEGYVQREIRLALDIANEKLEGTIFIIPARIRNCDVPIRLSAYQWVDIFSGNGYEKLLKALSVRAKDLGVQIPPNKPAPNEVAPVDLSNHLITNSEYRIFVKNTNHRRPHNWNITSPYFSANQGGNPVVTISWEDAVAYCDWADGSLPGAEISTPIADAPEILEWWDAGDEQKKQVRNVRTTSLVSTLDRGTAREDIGFRCVPVRSVPLRKWIFIGGGRYRLGTDLANFELLATTHRLLDTLRRPIIGRQIRSYSVPDFRITSTCVTNEEYFVFTQATGGKWPSHWNPKRLNSSDRPFPARLASQPVVNIGAEDAEAYCIWSRTRLPTWREWESAAAGLDRRSYPWGNNYTSSYCNSMESGRGSVTPVDEYPLGDTPEGVRQLCGNVGEWVISPTAGRFEIRGGSFSMPCEIWGLTYAFRQADIGFRAPDVGFRVVTI